MVRVSLHVSFSVLTEDDDSFARTKKKVGRGQGSGRQTQGVEKVQELLN
jgi:hypothetical protein